MTKTLEWNQWILLSICLMMFYEIANCAIVNHSKSKITVPCKKKPDLEFQSTCVQKKECWYYVYKGAVKLKEYNDIEYCNPIEDLVCCPAEEYKKMFSSSIKIVEEKCEEYSQYRFHNFTEDGVNFSSTAPPEDEAKISGGSIANPLDFPHMLRVGVMHGPSPKWFCGATLISEKYALSAAHCGIYGNMEKSELVIGLGGRDMPEMKNRQTLFKVIKQHFPPNKNQIKDDSQKYADDIMLFELNITITFDRYVRPICLYTSPSLPPEGTKAAIVGWRILPDHAEAVINELVNQHSSKYPHKGTVRLDSSQSCNRAFMNTPTLYNSSSMLCSKINLIDSVPCKGDGGGPIQIPLENRPYMFKQLGIISQGDVTCRRSTYRPVYTKISFYIGWIQSIVWPENRIEGNESDDGQLILNSTDFPRKLTEKVMLAEK